MPRRLRLKVVDKQGNPGRPKGCKSVVRAIDKEGLYNSFLEMESAFFEYRVALTKFLEDGNKSAAKEAKRKAYYILNLAKEAKPAIQMAMDDMILKER